MNLAPAHQTPQSSNRQPPGLHQFAASLRSLASRQTVDETLQLAVDLSTELVRGCDFADIMFIREGGITTPVSTHETARCLDRLQDETGEGPCRTATTTSEAVVTDDLADDERWPSFGPRAVDEGVHSAAAYQLFLHRNEDDRLGSLNLYGTTPAAFDEESVELGSLFAAHCATSLAAATEREGAQAALESRDVIGQAKGILMARHQLTASDAFDLIRETSQARHVKVRDLAQEVADTGDLP